MAVDVATTSSVSAQRERRADQGAGCGKVSARCGVARPESRKDSRAAIDEADGERVDYGKPFRWSAVMRIFLTGAHSTGKTTLATALSERLRSEEHTSELQSQR